MIWRVTLAQGLTFGSERAKLQRDKLKLLDI